MLISSQGSLPAYCWINVSFRYMMKVPHHRRPKPLSLFANSSGVKNIPVIGYEQSKDARNGSELKSVFLLIKQNKREGPLDTERNAASNWVGCWDFEATFAESEKKFKFRAPIGISTRIKLAPSVAHLDLSAGQTIRPDSQPIWISLPFLSDFHPLVHLTIAERVLSINLSSSRLGVERREWSCLQWRTWVVWNEK